MAVALASRFWLTGMSQNLSRGSDTLVSDSDRVATLIAGVEPELQIYQRLKQALIGYRMLGQHNALPSITLNVTLRPGEYSVNLDHLRQLLIATGYLFEQTSEPALSDNHYLYQGVLVQAVRN